MEQLSRSFAEVVKIKIARKSPPNKSIAMKPQDTNMKYTKFIIPAESTKLDWYEATLAWVNKYC